jgi:hypothetical protein
MPIPSTIRWLFVFVLSFTPDMVTFPISGAFSLDISGRFFAPIVLIVHRKAPFKGVLMNDSCNKNTNEPPKSFPALEGTSMQQLAFCRLLERFEQDSNQPKRTHQVSQDL